MYQSKNFLLLFLCLGFPFFFLHILVSTDFCQCLKKMFLLPIRPYGTKISKKVFLAIYIQDSINASFIFYLYCLNYFLCHVQIINIIIFLIETNNDRDSYSKDPFMNITPKRRGGELKLVKCFFTIN